MTIELPDGEIEALIDEAQARFWARYIGILGPLRQTVKFVAARVRAEAVAGERQRIKTGLMEEFYEGDPKTDRDHGYNAGIRQALWATESGFATGSVPVATPTGHVHGFAISGRCVCGAVATLTEPPACACDGASYYSPAQNAARRPFVINKRCPIHGAASPVPQCGDVSAVKGWAPCDRETGHDGPHTWPLIPPPVPGDQT